ncbi:Uncharacterised protein [uncultured archaeon]|nr:Uncharacterised protein [uncultured archaeon]
MRRRRPARASEETHLFGTSRQPAKQIPLRKLPGPSIAQLIAAGKVRGAKDRWKGKGSQNK